MKLYIKEDQDNYKYDDIDNTYDSRDKYTVGVYDIITRELGPRTNTSNIKKAVLTWFQYGEKYPTCAYIDTDNSKYALDLLKYCNDNQDMLIDFAEKYHCPYKIDYLLTSISKQVLRGKATGSFDVLDDSIEPFTVG